MDYEKKYKEALEWARKVMQGKVGFVLDEVLEKFPELKESEDERMRRWIINYLDNKALNSGIIQEKTNIKNAIAWLEKQGEQKPVIPKFRVGDIIRWKKADSVEYTIKEINDNGYINTADGIMDILQTDIDFELVEQKPVVPLDENGEPILTDFESALFTAISCFWQSYNLGEEVNIAEFVKEYAPELLEAANKQQKPTEEYNITGIGSKHATGKLKEMLDKKENPAWSEEDTEILNMVMQSCEKCGNEYVVYWLKSLKDRYTWKPSDEQMEAVKCAALDVSKFSLRSEQLRLENEPYYKALVSLYQDLKKLTE